MKKIRTIEELKQKIVIKTNKSPILLFFRILLSIIIVDTIMLIIISFIDFLNIEQGGFIISYSLEESILILFFLAHIFFFIYLFIYWFVDYFIIKDGKIHHYNGILFKRKELFMIKSINSIELYQSFFGRIFDYGNIILYYNEQTFILKNIPYPEEFIEFIELFKVKK